MTGVLRDRNGLRHKVAQEGCWDWTRAQQGPDGRWVQFFRLRGSDPDNPTTVPFGELDLVTADDEEYQRLKLEVFELRDRNDKLERLFSRIATRDSQGWTGRVLRGELTQVITLHGPINKQLVPSVVKRVIGKIASEVERALQEADTEPD